MMQLTLIKKQRKNPIDTLTGLASFAICVLCLGISIVLAVGVSAPVLSAPVAPPPACSLPNFTPPTVVNVGRALELAVADFNGDNKLDVVTPNNLSNGSVRILLGDGMGGFTSSGNVPVGRSPISVATSDFNNDGKVDIVVANGSSFQTGEASIVLQNSTGGFGSPINIRWGSPINTTTSVSIAVADFNSDGNSDVAVINLFFGSRILIGLGDGTGQFTNLQTIFTGLSPSHLIAPDINGDSKPDLAFSDLDASTVSVLIGDGTGLFGPAANFNVGTAPEFIVSGDFNADLKLDLAVANRASNNISVLINNGIGAFAPAVHYPSGGDLPISIASDDFNGDGQTDLAVVNTNPRNLLILQNQGAGVFKATAAFMIGGIPEFIAAADFNGDERPDLATVHELPQEMRVFLNNCESPVEPTVSLSQSSYFFSEGSVNTHVFVVRNGNLSGSASVQYATSDVSAVSPGDYTAVSGTLAFADGEASKMIALPLVNDVLDEDVETFQFSLNNAMGNASLGSPASAPVTIVDDDAPPEVSISDIFHPEGNSSSTTASFAVTLSSPSGLTVTVNYATADGAASAGTDYVSATGMVTFAPGETVKTIDVSVAGDVSAEIDENFFVNLTNPSNATLVVAQAVGTILDDDSACPAPKFQLDSNLAVGTPIDIASGDFNGDSKGDLVIANTLGDAVVLFLSDGNGGFGNPTSFSVGMRPRAISVGDFNGDSKLDVVTVNHDSSGGPSSLSILLGNGTGGFSPANTTSPVPIPMSVAVGDVNTDGKLDLAIVSLTASPGNGFVSILLGDGLGGFGAPTSYTTGVSSVFGALANLTGDDKLDIVVANLNSHDVSVLINNGDGTFAPAVSVPLGDNPNSVAIGDLNGDNKSDLVVLGDFAPANIRILLGNGDGSFSSPATSTVGERPVAGKIVDLNGDGRLDLAISDAGGSFSPGGVWVLFGNGAGSFGVGTRYTLGETPIATDVADFNGDTKPDLATANLNSSQVSVLLNSCASTPQTTFQFSSSNYVTNESTSSVNITITRNGDASAIASVAYTTTDADTFTVNCADIAGNAFARCDFATSVDTLTFAPGETSKTFQIPIINDSNAEGNETFGVTLSNATGATIGTPGTATITITDNEAADGANPIFQSPFFVRQHYLDFLSREPEPDGLNAWLDVLNNCPDVNNLDPNSPSAQCDRIIVSQSFFGSVEFQLKGYFVYRFYKLAFNRLPLYTEIVVDMRAVTGATQAEVFAKRAAFANNFAQRTEFMNLYNGQTNTQYVNTLMNRYSLTSITTPDPATPDGTTKVTLTNTDLVNRLNGVGGTLTRAQVLRAIADSDQVFQLEFNRAFVAMQYFGYLRRDPETAGFNAWLNFLNANPTQSRTMINGFMNSIEYRLRFGP